MTFRTALYAIIGLIILHVLTAYVFNVYGVWDDFDVPMHFLGGFVAGMLGIAVHHAVTDKHHFKKGKRLYHYLFVLGFVMLIGVAWEFHEYVLDQLILAGWVNLELSQLSVGDTMMDFLMDGVGGLAAVRVFERKL